MESAPMFNPPNVSRLLCSTVLAAAAVSLPAIVSAGGFCHHRYAPVSVARLDYAPYTYYGGPSVHGPVLYNSVGFVPLPYGPSPVLHRSYYSPLNYGYRTPYGFGPYASPYSRLGYGYGGYGFAGYGYGYRGYHFTRYGIYGGSYSYAPLTVGYPYATGYLSAVRPVQPYLHAYQAPAYTPCVYGSYGYSRY